MDKEFLFGKGFDNEGPGMALFDRLAGSPTPIEDQEARGQAKLCRTQNFPKDMQRPQEVYEAMGFVFGEDVDDQFISCTFPEGWEMRPTDHSMHNDIVDEQGRKRIGIFYKAAFYDRKAIAYPPLTRYVVEWDYEDKDGSTYYVKDNSTEDVLFNSSVPKSEGSVFSVDNRARANCEVWLNEQFPDWQNPMAYWDAGASERRSETGNPERDSSSTNPTKQEGGA